LRRRISAVDKPALRGCTISTCNEHRKIVEIAPLVDLITDGSIGEAIRRGADHRFAEAMERLGNVHFVNLIVDAGTVDQIKSIRCLLSNLDGSHSPVLLALRENRNFNLQDCYDLFSELMAIVNSFRLV
jgi:Mg-chelatase subunit ChlD